MHLFLAGLLLAQTWPQYYEPELGREVTAKTDSGFVLTLDRAYLLHRDDAERWLECRDALDACLEARKEDLKQEDNLWVTVALMVSGLLVGGLSGAVIVASVK